MPLNKTKIKIRDAIHHQIGSAAQMTDVFHSDCIECPNDSAVAKFDDYSKNGNDPETLEEVLELIKFALTDKI